MTQSNQKKRLLANPVDEYRRLHPRVNEVTLALLQDLAQHHTGLQRQYRENQQHTRRLSGQIGRARKADEPIEDLMNSMKQYSRQMKALSSEITAIRAEIIACFDGDEKQPVSKSDKKALTGRIYRSSESSPRKVTIQLESPPQDDWNHYIDTNPAASIYHRSEWKQLIKQTFGHTAYYFSARDPDSKLVGILPLIHLNSRLFGDFLVSMPYFNYGGAIADHPDIEQQLMQTANSHAAGLGVSHIEYRDDTPRRDMPARTEKVSMIFPLPDSHESLWQSFTPKLRAQIRRPQKEAPEVFLGGNEYLDDFYSVFARNMRDLGTPVYSKDFFRNMLSGFPEACQILVVRLHNRPVAAGFLLAHRDTLEIPWASAIRDVNHLSMNMLLYWEALKYAIDRNMRQFDFGRSSRDAGTFRFKQQWGARAKPLYWHYWLRDGGDLPSINPDNKKYALMISLWKRLPVSVSTMLGPNIVKNIP